MDLLRAASRGDRKVAVKASFAEIIQMRRDPREHPEIGNAFDNEIVRTDE